MIPDNVTQLALSFSVPIIVAVAACLLHLLIFKILANVARRTSHEVDDLLVKHCYTPSLWLVVVAIVLASVPAIKADPEMLDNIRRALGLVLTGSAFWLLAKLVFVARDSILNRYRMDVKDNLAARRVHTQLQVLVRIVVVVLAIVALGTMLLTFERVRQLGTTILASAGIAGIVIGIAAQRSISTVIAGIQIAITQPIRLDDVVIVENEWGRVEEITLTYVVVQIWDLRRLILPITYFIEKPFQNWTRTCADLLGTAYLYVDYTVPIESLRQELHRILQESPHWDKKVWALQVTNTTERTIELRALMSAEDASRAWNLRCEVREKLVEFVQKNYPDGLPRLRLETTTPD